MFESTSRSRGCAGDGSTDASWNKDSLGVDPAEYRSSARYGHSLQVPKHDLE